MPFSGGLILPHCGLFADNRASQQLRAELSPCAMPCADDLQEHGDYLLGPIRLLHA